ncbi:MAG TPA: aromatic amino acid hydroxylase [Mucilaginibacter sp.]|jgi:phenylalanine-4-hydroxylase|nr:aromatic amino acid hydroxylase [Mucilaginibacter sp.]
MSHFNDFGNPQVAALPAHLKQFIVDQRYEHYTPVDHAVWRYVMRQNYSYLKDVAYYPYIPGLLKAGLTIEKIPSLQEMNDALGKIGWGAVTVDGFIPPAAFMEYQAYRVLVIAADIRQLKHIEYTPAPDIIHESAGHAPIIADKDYHEYLSYFGSIGAKAMFSAQDFELYEAIRALSILKEMPDASETAISKAEETLAHRQENMGEPSEMALLSRLHWWTVEYGLIGPVENPKIYGAGLLSSIGESVTCMQSDVRKLTYTIDAINYAYDITKAQPQLFVTSSFQNLIDVLETFADKMAFRVGGAYGLQKALESKNTCTAVFSSGLQLTGTFTAFETDENGQPIFIRTTGPSALAIDGKQLAGHSKDYHHHGYSTPVGKLKGHDIPFENLNVGELAYFGIAEGSDVTLLFESGISVSGHIKTIVSLNGNTQLITFAGCTVKNKNGKILFEPSWGEFDMAVGEKIVSVFCGAADKDAFVEIIYKSNIGTHRTVYDAGTLELHELYQQVRNRRHNGGDFGFLGNVWFILQKNHQDDWLCALEILEILEHEGVEHALADEIRGFLKQKAETEPEYSKLIVDGLYLIEHPVEQKLVV